MSSAHNRRENQVESASRLIILFSYLAGLVTVLYLRPGFWKAGADTSEILILYNAFPALVLIFASSILGPVLLPLTACLFGAASGRISLEIINAYLICGSADAKILLTALVMFPVFFIAAVNGMCTSKLILNSVLRSGPAFKNACINEYLPVTLAVIAAAAAACFIKG